MSYSPLHDDVEWGVNKPFTEPTYEFAERQIRQGFVRKVFGILAFQLALTAGVGAAFVAVPNVKLFVAANPWTLWGSLGLSFALILVLACSESARRNHPTNLLLLFSFTLCQAVLVGTASATVDTQVLLLAVGITAAVVFSLVVFTLQTKVDVTSLGGVLYTLLITLLAASIIQMFLHVQWLHLAICTGGAALFSVYLIFDLQLIMGNSEVSIGPDEYVLAALNLYLDILNIFLYILQLVNELSKNN
mmetsp:Transcript_11446/g.24601  ORF Transcript_11446/g.24601 Transcript_11446/m.24601 type:complete len:247 (-) Transcript_11446:327-1067(-)|eukprot:CAMPEP_0202890576 /NCGR_PEP_ID=MMETSP1392-20130828/933_1 /ASSEMBLY_ACC=CAM_ASM_000868 /TAXON_ID=225041 /ORGANISM="Chlamydomonas chlamydogama, Strain SAG 11-48b" /LENGTH=246 /DNA_ID=CAMNT_0049574173 /DNA_START=82 /DNA_END=822 /DNA_ORIENTATION=-